MILLIRRMFTAHAGLNMRIDLPVIWKNDSVVKGYFETYRFRNKIVASHRQEGYYKHRAWISYSERIRPARWQRISSSNSQSHPTLHISQLCPICDLLCTSYEITYKQHSIPRFKEENRYHYRISLKPKSEILTLYVYDWVPVPLWIL